MFASLSARNEKAVHGWFFWQFMVHHSFLRIGSEVVNDRARFVETFSLSILQPYSNSAFITKLILACRRQSSPGSAGVPPALTDDGLIQLAGETPVLPEPAPLATSLDQK
jgi:hypothetical protein